MQSQLRSEFKPADQLQLSPWGEAQEAYSSLREFKGKRNKLSDFSQQPSAVLIFLFSANPSAVSALFKLNSRALEKF